MDIRILTPNGASAADQQQAIDLWTREDVLPRDVAEHRAPQLLAMASEAGQLIGVATGFVQRVPRLGQPMLIYRTYVSVEHRLKSVATEMLQSAFTKLELHFRQQPDPEAIGMLLVIPAELAKLLDQHYQWPGTQFSYIGQDQAGDQLRVRYFDKVPLKSAGS